VKPGGLTTSRSIGDADSKLKEKGGAGGVVVPDPDIYSLQLDQDLDFLLLGSDGVFDFVTPQEAVKLVWETAADWKAAGAGRDLCYQDMLGSAVNSILDRALRKNGDDNLTLLLLIFQPFKLKTI
jgi:protein phosphatase 2C family protein 2/3